MAQRQGVCVGFDREEERQIAAIARWRAMQQRPLDVTFRDQRARQDVARHRVKELRWRTLVRYSLYETDPVVMARNFERVLLREILELLPLAERQEVLACLARGSVRRIERAARLVRRTLPEVVNEALDESRIIC